jgi:hypothetical protein
MSCPKPVIFPKNVLAPNTANQSRAVRQSQIIQQGRCQPIKVVETQGDTGPPGEMGPTGDQGPAGDTGPPGQDGSSTNTGATGPPGQEGAPGTNGTNGTNGAKGEKGDTGPAQTVYLNIQYRYGTSEAPTNIKLFNTTPLLSNRNCTIRGRINIYPATGVVHITSAKYTLLAFDSDTDADKPIIPHQPYPSIISINSATFSEVTLCVSEYFTTTSTTTYILQLESANEENTTVWGELNLQIYLDPL